MTSIGIVLAVQIFPRCRTQVDKMEGPDFVKRSERPRFGRQSSRVLTLDGQCDRLSPGSSNMLTRRMFLNLSGLGIAAISAGCYPPVLQRTAHGAVVSPDALRSKAAARRFKHRLPGYRSQVRGVLSKRRRRCRSLRFHRGFVSQVLRLPRACGIVRHPIKPLSRFQRTVQSDPQPRVHPLCARHHHLFPRRR